jgi:Arc/MetJ-type ribon-helix-helix transcriptional regulator
MPMKEREAAKELHDHRGDQEEWEDTPVKVKVQPARTEVVSFRLPSDQLDVIEGLADQAGQSISEFIRSAVLAYISGETMEPFLDANTDPKLRLHVERPRSGLSLHDGELPRMTG